MLTTKCFMLLIRYKLLFGPSELIFSLMTLKFLRSDWPGLFRAQILPLMPAVSMAVLLCCAGWNLFRALKALKKRGIRDFTSYSDVFGRCPRVLACRLKPTDVVLSYHKLIWRQPGDIYPSVAV